MNKLVPVARVVAVAMGLATAAIALQAQAATPPRQMEKLDRGTVAVPAAEGVLVSWRLLGTDPADIAFNLYRDGRKLNGKPLTGATSFLDKRANGTGDYTLAIVQGGTEKPVPGKALMLKDGYLTVPLQQPPGGTTPAGEAYTYNANDASVGDLDGDGQYEIILKWDPSNSKDNAFPGYTGPVILDAYRLTGEHLWRINLGPNIRAGAHYTQFLVYDFDGDGKAELAVRTSDGTVDGTGTVIGDAKTDWRGDGGEVPQADRTGAMTKPDGRKVAPMQGRIVKGPEYLTVFEGATGKALATQPYLPGRDDATDAPTPERMTEVWGDGYANRSDRFLAGVAYLDGERPSIVMARGYYTRSTLAAWDWRDGKLTQRWLFDSAAPGNQEFAGQGNHQLSVADVDGDGRDEIIYGSMAVDDDGKGLWSARLGHGDALHVSDLDPLRPGLERFGVHEEVRHNGGIGAAMLDAATGKILWTTPAEKDTGRGLAADIDPRSPGAEVWGSNSPNLYSARGDVIAASRPRQTNFAIWWDGDLLRELLDREEISKWDWQEGKTVTLLAPEGVSSNNGTKANPALSADILGDWREEVIWRTKDNQALRIYVSPWPTDYRFVTLMHDPVYRLGIAWQNVAYNQPPHTSYYLGVGMAPPPKVNIRTP
ncbi:rhamnogalacturonan lyase [Niveispirillum irakense]|uniref:rhamnogalacturonan lyase n=1 Tax=Niveispirillum irakense TaxID=34011 RepID=UPI0003FEF28F|nr:rhamnogalacturonan lyase [Niveispirillum irakense]